MSRTSPSHRSPKVAAPSAAYSLEAQSETPAVEVPMGWRFSGEIVARAETSGGVTYFAKLDSGTMLLIRPLVSFEGTEAFVDTLVAHHEDDEDF